MNRVVDVLLRKVFSDYKLAPAQNKGEINVVNLRLNPEAEVFGFLRSLPVQITEGTAASVTLSGVSFLSILRDVWRAYRNNQVDLALKVKVSDVSSAQRFENLFVCGTCLAIFCPSSHDPTKNGRICRSLEGGH
jgi:hypothetical protein